MQSGWSDLQRAGVIWSVENSQARDVAQWCRGCLTSTRSSVWFPGTPPQKGGGRQTTLIQNIQKSLKNQSERRHPPNRKMGKTSERYFTQQLFVQLRKQRERFLTSLPLMNYKLKISVQHHQPTKTVKVIKIPHLKKKYHILERRWNNYDFCTYGQKYKWV